MIPRIPFLAGTRTVLGPLGSTQASALWKSRTSFTGRIWRQGSRASV